MNALFAAKAPTGSITVFAGSSAPADWLLCYGQAISRTTYAALYAIIGTTYGAGDGSTTFNLPDLRGRFPLGKDNMGGTSANRVTATQADNLGQGTGAESHTLTTTEMPAHTHSYTAPGSGGAYSAGPNGGGVGSTTGSAGSSGAHNNMPPYITLNYIIKT